MEITRYLRHLFSGPWAVRRYFPASVMHSIEQAIKECEAKHSAEVCFAVEHALELKDLLARKSAREKAIEMFSELRVWDTEENNGVLIYLLLADRNIEIVADRGISSRVEQSDWERICLLIEESFKRGDFEGGMKKGLIETAELLAKHFPPKPGDKDELNNRPFVV